MATKLFKVAKNGKYRIYEIPVQTGKHIAEITPRETDKEVARAQALQYLALFAAAPKLLSVAKLALSTPAHSMSDWNLRVRPLLEEAIAEAEDRGV